jgi:hypothetical protein
MKNSVDATLVHTAILPRQHLAQHLLAAVQASSAARSQEGFAHVPPDTRSVCVSAVVVSTPWMAGCGASAYWCQLSAGCPTCRNAMNMRMVFLLKGRLYI